MNKTETQMYDAAVRLRDMCDFVMAIEPMLTEAEKDYWRDVLSRERVRLEAMAEQVELEAQ